MKTIVGLLAVAAIATAGDAIWYTFGVRHTMVAGLLHGALLLTAVGAVLGAANGRLLKGLPLGTLAGLGGAASYYVLVALVDRRTYGSAIPASWVIMWLILAALEGRWLHAPDKRTWAGIAGRGLAAAVLGGVAFYLVVNVLWGRPPAGGRNYLLQFLAWAFAWAPGLFALTIDGAVTTLSITPKQLLDRLDRGETVHVLDVRSEAEFAGGHVPGAVNVPFTQLLSRPDRAPGAVDDELIVYCGHGPRAHVAATALRRGGRKRLVFLSGHWAAWQAARLRIEQ